jgi:hypothetical protein
MTPTEIEALGDERVAEWDFWPDRPDTPFTPTVYFDEVFTGAENEPVAIVGGQWAITTRHFTDVEARAWLGFSTPPTGAE